MMQLVKLPENAPTLGVTVGLEEPLTGSLLLISSSLIFCCIDWKVIDMDSGVTRLVGLLITLVTAYITLVYIMYNYLIKDLTYRQPNHITLTHIPCEQVYLCVMCTHEHI